jgi:hypothetical protein
VLKNGISMFVLSPALNILLKKIGMNIKEGLFGGGTSRNGEVERRG